MNDRCFCKRSFFFSNTFFIQIILIPLFNYTRLDLNGNDPALWLTNVFVLSVTAPCYTSFSQTVPLNHFPSFFVSVFFPSSGVECCGSLWPSVSWLWPGHRTARCPTSRSCRTWTGPGWVGRITRLIKFCDHIRICFVVLSLKFFG